jgi:uncharacterized protein (DUF362 family)
MSDDDSKPKGRDRRQFLKLSAFATGAVVLAGCRKAAITGEDLPGVSAMPLPSATALPLMNPTDTPMPTEIPPVDTTGRVVLVRTDDRTAGIRRALELWDHNTVQGKELFLKPNFNSADDFPGSTHIETLKILVDELGSLGAEHITIGDRSGMGDTRSVMRSKDVFALAGELGVSTLVFDELSAQEWELWQPTGSHWLAGFAVPKPVLAADGIVQTCCLKTHRYGGHFTLSLKNSVGLAAKWVPGNAYNYMTELHNSSHQRRMIAEINQAYQPDLVVLDGMEAFVDGGPARGTKVAPGVILVGADRVAIDSVGVAILRYYGTTPEVAGGRIFEQQQIARAVELGLGVTEPSRIELITGDERSEEFGRELVDLLA